MRKFTLIELIVVVVTISILAAIISPNISNFGKTSKATAMAVNERGVEAAVDRFYIKNGYYPVDSESSEIDNKQRVDLDKLTPEFLHEKPKGEFFVDKQGKVTQESEEKVPDVMEMPTVKKSFEDEGKTWNYLVHGQEFFTTTKITIPQNVKSYNGMTIVDTTGDWIQIESAKVLVEGKESNVKAEIDGQKVSVYLDKNNLSKMKGKEVVLYVHSKSLMTYSQRKSQMQATVVVDIMEDGKVKQETLTSNSIQTHYNTLKINQIVKGERVEDYQYFYNIPETTRELTFEFTFQIPKSEEVGELSDFQYLEFKNLLESELQIISAEVFFNGVKDTSRKEESNSLFLNRIYADEYTKYQGKEMVVKVNAKLRDGFDVEESKNWAYVNMHYKNGKGIVIGSGSVFLKFSKSH